MLYMITGGSGSGKSEYAENLLLSLGERRRIYVATMIPWDEECRRKIARHRQLRARKGFETIEQYCDIETVLAGEGGTEAAGDKPPVVLLECLSNLTANELFAPEKKDDVVRKLLHGLRVLRKRCADLVVVTNEVFSDGTIYDPETREYQRILGAVNRTLAAEADQVIEVVYGIPLVIKQTTQKGTGDG